ncbi:MAG: glycerol-3-phosphate acyltransferase [bacterium]|nr:glycerol-3-phosphate acyltransferase [bacterium]
MPEITLPLLLKILACFLLGSIPFAVVSMFGSGVDIRDVGSGNPGFNNVLRFSRARAVICLIGDLGKGIASVLVFSAPGDPVEVKWLFGFAVMLGHCYSPFLRFDGGKGIATSAGVMLVLYPHLAVPCIVLYAVGRVVGKKLKIRENGAITSLTCWAVFAILLLITEGGHTAAYAAAMLAILTWRHKDNFERLMPAARA